MEAPYIPNACRTEVTPDGRFVRVIYEQHDHANRVFLIPAMQFPAFAKVLQVQAEQLPGTRYKRAFLAPGETMAVDGFDLKSGPRGEFVLTVSARISDAESEHGVTIPIPVSAQSAQKLRDTLDQRLSAEIEE